MDASIPAVSAAINAAGILQSEAMASLNAAEEAIDKASQLIRANAPQGHGGLWGSAVKSLARTYNAIGQAKAGIDAAQTDQAAIIHNLLS